MVAMIENSSDLKLRDFGKQINQSQSGEIEVMKQLLKSIGQFVVMILARGDSWAYLVILSQAVKAWGAIDLGTKGPSDFGY